MNTLIAALAVTIAASTATSAADCGRRENGMHTAGVGRPTDAAPPAAGFGGLYAAALFEERLVSVYEVSARTANAVAASCRKFSSIDPAG